MTEQIFAISVHIGASHLAFSQEVNLTATGREKKIQSLSVREMESNAAARHKRAIHRGPIDWINEFQIMRDGAGRGFGKSFWSGEDKASMECFRNRDVRFRG